MKIKVSLTIRRLIFIEFSTFASTVDTRTQHATCDTVIHCAAEDIISYHLSCTGRVQIRMTRVLPSRIAKYNMSFFYVFLGTP